MDPANIVEDTERGQFGLQREGWADGQYIQCKHVDISLAHNHWCQFRLAECSHDNNLICAAAAWYKLPGASYKE